MMLGTVLEHLTKPNVNLKCYEGYTTPTYNNDWDPIEDAEEWDKFNFQNLQQWYAPDLAQVINFNNLAPSHEKEKMNKIYSEHGLNNIIYATNMFTISANLSKNLFIADGSRTLGSLDVSSDWGAGNKTKTNNKGRAKALLGGDTKYTWKWEDAVFIIKRSRHGYESAPGKQLILPLEQSQHYARKNSTHYQFLITEGNLFVACFCLSSELIWTSSRPQRSTRFQGHFSHVTSTPTISAISEAVPSVGAMSIDEEDFLPTIGLMQYSMISCKGREDGMTINLTLYFLIHLANKDNSLQPSYPPLSPPLTRTILASKSHQGPGGDGTGTSTPRDANIDKGWFTTTSSFCAYIFLGGQWRTRIIFWCSCYFNMAKIKL